MSELESLALPSVDTAVQGTVSAQSGQADLSPTEGTAIGTPTATGQPEPSSTQSEQPESKPESRLFKDLDSAERDYKALQAAYTRASQTLSRLGDLDSVQSQLAVVQQLKSDPDFIEWAKGRIAKEQAGSDDPDTRRALEIIDQRAMKIAQQMVAPIMATHIEQRTERIFSDMTKEFGDDWRAHQPKMLEILQDGIRRGHFHPSVETNFDLKFVKTLYAAATSDDPNYAARQYQKRLDKKQAQTTVSTPGPSPSALGTGKANTLDEAFAAAKKQLGVA